MIAVATILGCIALWLGYCVYVAPDGYEDATGFHRMPQHPRGERGEGNGAGINNQRHNGGNA